MARSKAYVVHPAAWAEIEAAADWYQEHSGDAAISFLDTILDALEAFSSTTTLACILIQDPAIRGSAFPIFYHLYGRT